MKGSGENEPLLEKSLLFYGSISGRRTLGDQGQS
jgi:hypothetical protein